jgi:hypothetical protein
MNGTPPQGVTKKYTIKEVMSDDFTLPAMPPSNIVPKEIG